MRGILFRSIGALAALSLFLAAPAGAKTLLDVVLVIDDTGSMANEISSIQSGMASFMGSLTSDYDAQIGVVSFDDPAIMLWTTLSSDVGTVQLSVNSIFAAGGGDCPEYSITGIRTGADAAMGWRSGSYRQMFLFTDAGAKDVNIPANNLVDTQAQLISSGISLHAMSFVSSCNYLDPVYGDLAAATGGTAQYGLQTITTDPLDSALSIIYASVPTVVPVPAAVWLFGSALGFLGWTRRKNT